MSRRSSAFFSFASSHWTTRSSSRPSSFRRSPRRPRPRSYPTSTEILQWTVHSKTMQQAMRLLKRRSTTDVRRKPKTANQRHHSMTRPSPRKPSPTRTLSTSGSISTAIGTATAMESREDDFTSKLFRQTMMTISSLSNTTRPSSLSSAKYPLPPTSTHVPVFHTQSMLFLFGFLFFPCWWIGAFLIKEEKDEEDDKMSHTHDPSCQWFLSRPLSMLGSDSRGFSPSEKTVVAEPTLPPPAMVMMVHPSLLANGRVSARYLWMKEKDDGMGAGFRRQDNYMMEKKMYRRYNKCMSFASLALLTLLVGMLIWYKTGVQNNWWKPVFSKRPL
ncbi:uncharacterized protein BYT42DRAFT_402389 [Radiomyces spectabilis]|uniref:uncharacterized protein n=1 Tax=Radiomyces spectabilis TaxID=64574 RepID=UPI00222007B0|nr:uncharacterized protein BYT42DRAFT_402389 [Radiomyces spectabilis]KAI8374383.1 hypothetical protein BYT42DRAFT_402389 [Radiomyces spectabilis]